MFYHKVTLVGMLDNFRSEYYECRFKVRLLFIGNVFAKKITRVLSVKEQKTDSMSEAIEDFAAFLLRTLLVRHSIHLRLVPVY